MVSIKTCLALAAAALLPYATARKCVGVATRTSSTSGSISESARLYFQDTPSDNLDEISSHDLSFNLWDPITLKSDKLEHGDFVLNVEKSNNVKDLIGGCKGTFGNQKDVSGKIESTAGAGGQSTDCTVVLNCS